MREGDIVLSRIPQADGITKNRPAVLLRELPPFADFLVCGISSQLHQCVPAFDDIVTTADSDFAGVLALSGIRSSGLDFRPCSRVPKSSASSDQSLRTATNVF